MTIAPTVESFQFKAETTQLLNLMIHSLYTQKGIFLRELISNASDALDRLRFEGLTNPELILDDQKFEIRLKPDPTARTLTIADTGIGMSRQELIDQIGTIARSGTHEVRELMKQTQSAEAFAELIGQFGVGFYSAFMVADKVRIETRRAGQTEASRWESTGDGSYTLTAAERADCGTEVTLYLKQPDPDDGIEDYTDRWRLSAIVKQYSDFITYPIIYEGSPRESGVEADESKDVQCETINSMKPIWTRTRSEVKDSDYYEFYKQISDDWTEPLKVLALKAEGPFEHEAVLFIPSKAPHDLFYHAAEVGLRLYAKRVMVMDKCEDLLPRYLRFVKGVVDSSDLPLNISRQRLQQDSHIAHIRRWLTRKALDALSELRERENGKYLKFWGEFGRALKEGVSSDYENRDKLLPLLLFESSNTPKQLTTFKAYIERMKPEQTDILYLTGESREIIENSPHLEAPRQKGCEVLYLSDPVDELMVQSLSEIDCKKLKSVTKGKVSLGTVEENKQREEELRKREGEYATFLEAAQKKLDLYVRRVQLSIRLVSSPACLVTDEYEESPHLLRLLQRGKSRGPKTRRIMELNADHQLIARLHERFKSDADDPLVKDSMEILFELALLAEGLEVADPVRFKQLTLELLQKSL